MRKHGTLALPSTRGSSVEHPIGRWAGAHSAPAPTTMLIWTTLLDWPNRLEVSVAPCLPRRFQRHDLPNGAPFDSRHSGSNQLGLSHLFMIHHCYRCETATTPSWLTCQVFAGENATAESLPFRIAMPDLFLFNFG